ncbi:peptidoglycan-binding domain-containing protein [Mumia sp. DW29H23]|uniref:peptidoglycan-binding domain-containing protein n=1 Tax=Mumia sp. DW29H23 TaxID=3421241 RepID=UPI003D6818EE
MSIAPRFRVPIALATVLAALAATFAFATATAPSAEAASCFKTTLKVGSKGSCVKALQKRLGGLTADGSYGAATKKRVKAFQADTGLSADGVAGPKTWKKLRAYGTALGWKSGVTFYLCKVSSTHLRYSLWNNSGKAAVWKFKIGTSLYYSNSGLSNNRITKYGSFRNTAKSGDSKYFSVSVGTYNSYKKTTSVRNYSRSSLPTCI